VAVAIVGIGAGPIIIAVLAPAVVLVGVFTVVVTATVPSAAVTVSQNTRYVEANDRQENHPDNQGDGKCAFHGIQDLPPFISVRQQNENDINAGRDDLGQAAGSDPGVCVKLFLKIARGSDPCTTISVPMMCLRVTLLPVPERPMSVVTSPS